MNVKKELSLEKVIKTKENPFEQEGYNLKLSNSNENK